MPDRDESKKAPEPKRQAPAVTNPAVQLRQTVAGLPYQEQIQALQPETNMMYRSAPTATSASAAADGDDGTAPVQLKEAEQGADGAATTAADASQVQFTPPPATVTPDTQSRVEGQGLEWRTATYKGSIVGHYVVAVEGTPGNARGEEVPAEMAGFSLARDPQLEAWCDAFESALGQQAFTSEGKPAAAAMAGKAVELVDAYMLRLREAGAKSDELDGLFGRILGESRPSFAGAVGLDNSTVRAAAGGNLREQMTLSINFLYKFGADWVTRKGQDLDSFVTDAQALVSTAERPTSTLRQALDRLHLPSSDSDWLFPDDATITEQQNASRVRNPQNDSTTGMTAGDLGRAQLSDREIEHMRLKKSDLQSQKLTWGEGRRVWLINEATDFVQDLREASVPLGGGVSGTTGRIMSGASALGVGDTVGVRAAAIGYLIPIRAHTLWEIVQAAAAYGLAAPASDFSFYMSIEPFNTRGVYANPDFWKLVATTHRKMNG